MKLKSKMHQQEIEQLEKPVRIQEFLHKNEEEIILTCQMCDQFLCSASETICNHLFCESCLTQYLLYIDQCPYCKTKIRGMVTYSNKLLDNVVLDYIKTYERQQLATYNMRLEKHYAFKRNSTIDRSRIVQKIQVDILDDNYIWCTGKILKVFYNDLDSQIDAIIVRYDHSKNKEEIQLPSSRIAVKGTYTDRKEIPHYDRNNVVFIDNHRVLEVLDWKSSPIQNNNDPSIKNEMIYS